MARQTVFDADARVYWVPVGDGDEWEQVPETAHDTTGFEAAMVGTGKVLTDWKRGLSGLFGDSDAAAAEQAEADELFAPLAKAQPGATMAGQALPYLATAPLGGSAAAAGRFGSTVAGQAGLAGGMGFALNEGNVGERLQSGLMEGTMGAGGAFAGNMAGRLLNSMTDIYAGAAAGVKRAGGQVTPGQALDSPLLKRAEATLQSTGAFDEMGQANQTVLNRKAAAALGQSGSDLTPAGLGQAADDIGGRMNAALDTVDMIQVEPELLARVNKIGAASPFAELPELAEGATELTGKQYQQMRRQISDIVRSEAKTASPTANKMQYAQSTLEGLDDAFTEAASPGAAEALRTAREQWRNLVAMEKGIAVTSDGQVNAKSMNNALKSIYGSTKTRGKTGRLANPETEDLFKTMEAFSGRGVAPIVGDSGTATRAGLGLGLGALAGGATYGATEGDVTNSLIAALLATAGGRAYGKLGNLIPALGQAVPGMASAGRAAGQGLMADE